MTDLTSDLGTLRQLRRRGGFWHHLFGMDSKLGGGDCCGGTVICAPRIRCSVRFSSRFAFVELARHLGRPHSFVRLVASAHSSGELWLGGYLAGRLRIPLRPHTRDEVEFRDGIYGLLVWAIATL